jgi:Zn-dependent M16 (insulinase) family peptidase
MNRFRIKFNVVKNNIYELDVDVVLNVYSESDLPYLPFSKRLKFQYNTKNKSLIIISNMDNADRIVVEYYSLMEDRNLKIDKILS